MARLFTISLFHWALREFQNISALRVECFLQKKNTLTTMASYKMLPNNLCLWSNCESAVVKLLSSCHLSSSYQQHSFNFNFNIINSVNRTASSSARVTSIEKLRKMIESGLKERNLFLQKLHQGMRTTIVWVKMKGFSTLCSVEWLALHKDRCAFLVILGELSKTF